MHSSRRIWSRQLDQNEGRGSNEGGTPPVHSRAVFILLCGMADESKKLEEDLADVSDAKLWMWLGLGAVVVVGYCYFVFGF